MVRRTQNSCTYIATVHSVFSDVDMPIHVFSDLRKRICAIRAIHRMKQVGIRTRRLAMEAIEEVSLSS